MKSFRILALAPLALLALSACGPKRIDGSSDAAFKRSVELMSAGLSADDQRILTEGVMKIGLAGSNIFELGANPELVTQKIRTTLNGRTFAEIKMAVAKLEAEEAAKRAEEEKAAAAAKAEADKAAALAKAEPKKQ